MREKNRNSIASCIKLPQFTTMNVIDGQAGFIIYSSLIFYSLTIDNILNIIVILILSAVAVSMLTGDNSVLRKAADAKESTEKSSAKEQIELQVLGSYDRKAELNATNLINNLKSIGAEVKGTSLPILVDFNNYEFTIDKDGNVENIGNGENINATKIVAMANSFNEAEDKKNIIKEYMVKQ